jgi:uroporphyrinogen decarboxylase
VSDLFLKACRREPVERTPIWLMRQAGRYLPEYRALREKHDFLTLTRKPDLAAEVTLQPIRRFGFDAAILFADIMTPLVGCGVEMEFAPGPILAKPFRDAGDLEPIQRFDAEEAVPETLETIRILKRELDVPLIGFAGSPWTLACYLVDGKGTKDFAMTRALLHREPELASRLMEALGEMVADYAVAQVEAGAEAIQVFDTWADLLALPDYADFVMPALRRVFSRIGETGVPSIYYFPGNWWPDLGMDVLGVDWRANLHSMLDLVQGKAAIQGNLDPTVLLATPDEVHRRTMHVLDAAGNRPGHVFNLGHGIHKDTPIENVETLVETVREESRR